MIRWLHISDLHLGNVEVESRNMRKHLPKFLTENFRHIDYIFLTGDIRTAGLKYPDYTQQMAEYLRKLCEVCGIGTDRLFIVPGNHDVNRVEAGRDEAIKRVMFKRNGYYNPKVGKIEDKDSELIWNGEADFRNFLSNLYDKDRMSFYEDFKQPHFNIETDDFNIVHIDTNVVYTEEQEAFDLIVGTEGLFNALETINKKKPTILLTHYPITSLLQDEKKQVSILLQHEGVRLWLAGHEHDHILQRMRYGDMLQAGELRYEGNASASFLIGEYNPDTFKCEVRAFHWFNEGWSQYPIVNLDADRKEVHEFDLKPADSDSVLILTKKARKANKSSMDRLLENFDRSLLCKLSNEGKRCNLIDVLKDSWNSDNSNIILLGDGGMGKSTMLLDFCKNTTTPTLYISAEQLTAIGVGLVDYCKIELFDGNETDFHKALFSRYEHQSLILIVDGLNEVDSVNENRFINEIQRLNLYKGVQIVIASRTDFTNRYSLRNYNKVHLDKLTDDVLHTLFVDEEWKDIVASPNLHRLLQNPMLVTIYKEICSIISEFHDIDFLKWKLPVENPTDLFHNYYLAQIALMMKRHGAIGEKILTAMVCIDHILPAIAYKYETTYSINKTNADFHSILYKVIQEEKVTEDGLIEIRDQYRFRGELKIDYGIVADMLIDELHLLHRDKHTTSFTHQMYRDYLSSRYIINKTGKNENILEIWNTRTIPLPICIHVMNGSRNYWNGIAKNVKEAGEKDHTAIMLLNNLFTCFPSTVTGGIVDFSKLNLKDIQLPNLNPFEKKVSLKGSLISDFTLGINKKEGKPIHVMCFSPDHNYIAAAIGTTIIIFNINDSKEVFRYNIGKIPTQMIFYDKYLIINSGAFVILHFDKEWKYIGEIKTEGSNIFNSKIKTVIASGDDLYIYYNNRHLIFRLTDCQIIRLEHKPHREMTVKEGTSLMGLRQSVDIKRVNGIIDGETAIASVDTLTAKSYADGRIEISNEGEIISVLGERNTILLDAGISNDGNYAVTLSFEVFDDYRRIQIWDLNQKLKMNELLCDPQITRINLPENGRWIFGETENSTWVYDTLNQKDKWFDEIFVSNQHGKLIAFGDSLMRKSEDGKLVLYNLDTNESIECVSPYRDPSIIYPLKNERLAAVDKSGRYLKFNNDRDGKEVTIYPDGFEKIVAIQEFKNKPFMAVATYDGRISVYHTGTGKRIRILDNNFKVSLTTKHIEKTIMAHSDRRNHITIDFFFEKNVYGEKRGWWHHYPYRGKIDSKILDLSFNEKDNSLDVILANGKILFLSEDRCQYKGEAHIIVAFNTDAYYFNGAICSNEIAKTLKQNNCKFDELIIK